MVLNFPVSIIYVWQKYNNNLLLMHQQYFGAFEEDRLDGDGMVESQVSFGHVQPGKQMHIEVRLKGMA